MGFILIKERMEKKQKASEVGGVKKDEKGAGKDPTIEVYLILPLPTPCPTCTNPERLTNEEVTSSLYPL